MATLNDTELEELRSAFRKLSHDVRSPLTSILGLAELTLEDASLSDDSRENLTMLAVDAERLTTMITTMVDDIEMRFFSDREEKA